jgi:hypothetical protein
MTHAEVETLKLALNALQSAAAELYRASSYCNTYEVIGNTNDAITEIQKYLAAQPAVQEPIYQMQMIDGKWIDQAKQSYEYNKAHGHTVRIVYTTPPAPEQYTALEQALTRLQKRYAELEAKVAAQPKEEDLYDLALKADNGGQP